jgi:hypothetical protein
LALGFKAALQVKLMSEKIRMNTRMIDFVCSLFALHILGATLHSRCLQMNCSGYVLLWVGALEFLLTGLHLHHARLTYYHNSGYIRVGFSSLKAEFWKIFYQQIYEAP